MSPDCSQENWRNRKIYQDFWREKLLISNCNALAIDESTDATDTAQCATFIRGTDHGHNVTEEIASLVPLKDTTTAVYSFFLRNSAPNWMYYSSCSPIWIKQTWMRISSTLLNIPLTTLLKMPFLVCQSNTSCWLSLPIKGWCPQYDLKWCCLVTDFPLLVVSLNFHTWAWCFISVFNFQVLSPAYQDFSKFLPCPLWLHLLPAVQLAHLHKHIVDHVLRVLQRKRVIQKNVFSNQQRLMSGIRFQGNMTPLTVTACSGTLIVELPLFCR